MQPMTENELFRKQHEEAKRVIDFMLKDLGEQGFIDFYRIVHRHLNKEKLSNERILEMTELCPKYMFKMIQAMDTEMKKKGVTSYEI